MALPAILAAAASKIAGPVVGGIWNSRDISKGMKSYRDNVNQGTDVLNQGIAAADQAFSPYAQTGATATQGALSAIQNRQQAAQPTLSNTSAGGVSAWLDPSMAYSTDQANKGIQAAALAQGGAGGGMLKALSNNANKMAMTNWNNAANTMLEANNQNFGQQQQQYANKTGFDQSQIENLSGLAGQGLQAVGANQNVNAGYRSGINTNFGDIAANQQSGWNALGKNAKDLWTGLGSNVAGGITNIWGGK